MAVKKTRIYNDPAYVWDDGTLFNGYVLLVMNFPQLNGALWEYAVLNGVQRLRLPKAYKFPINEGFIEADSYVWANFSTGAFPDNSIHPPNTTYSPLYYDNSDRLIVIPNNNWGFTSVDQNLNAFGLGAFSSPPFISASTGQGQSSFDGVPTVETPTGTVDGANLVFTLSRVPRGLILFSDGLGPLVSPTNYTLSGATLTMVVAPNDAAQFKAYIF